VEDSTKGGNACALPMPGEFVAFSTGHHAFERGAPRFHA
jgi:hypothetical protein